MFWVYQRREDDNWIYSPFFRFSRSSLSWAVPWSNLLIPRGSPRHDAKLIEFSAGQLSRISLTASTETADPQRLRWLLNETKFSQSRGVGTKSLKLTSAGSHLAYQLALSKHYPVASASSPMPDRTRLNCEPISMRSIRDRSWEKLRKLSTRLLKVWNINSPWISCHGASRQEKMFQIPCG